MGLNKQKGNMYGFITHTWNTIKGECPHYCEYCYMKKWKNQPPLHFDEKELNTNLGNGKNIFVGSSCDMFAWGIPETWIKRTIDCLLDFPDNQYLLQTKNPQRFHEFIPDLAKIQNLTVCTTIETNRYYPSMGKTPAPEDRKDYFSTLPFRKYLTIEPIMDFDFFQMLKYVLRISPERIIIGADSQKNNLVEPSWNKVNALVRIFENEYSYDVYLKKNLKRLKK